jgi:hypothetical protein
MNPLPKILKRGDYIQEGTNPAPGAVLLACSIGDDDDDPRSRVFVLRDGLALSYVLEGDQLTSIDAAPDGSAWALGENGHVIRFAWRTPGSSAELAATVQRYKIGGVEDEGPLRRLRLLGSDVVAVGSVGQAAYFAGNGFVALPRLAVDGDEVTIEDLAGSSRTDLTVVSNDGYAARFDGQRWHKLDLPSNVPLNSIARLDDNRYAICGDGATLLIGAADQWRAIALPDDERDYWGVAADSDDTIYLAHVGGIDIVSGTSAQALKIPQRRQNEFIVLRSGPDGVWSFAGRSVGRITGGQWQVML